MIRISNDHKRLFPRYKDDNNGSLKCLLKSIYLVESKYIVYSNFEGKVVDGLERVFAYELYRQWANKIEKNKKLSGFTINGEVYKNTNKFYPKLKKKTFPDLVMHSGDGNINKQEIICEIKRMEGVSHKDIKKDIEKLWHFTNFKNKFKFGVFILVGATLEWLINEKGINIEEICKELTKFDKKKSKKIICISYIIDKGTEKKQMEICRLPELIRLSKNMTQMNE